MEIHDVYQQYLETKAKHPIYSDDYKYPPIPINRFEKYFQYLESIRGYITLGVWEFIFTNKIPSK